MGIFNWFGEQEHNTFDYKPIYYDKEKDELRQKFGRVDGTVDKEVKKEGYAPGSYIKGSLRNGNYQRTKRAGSKAQGIIGVIGLVLVIMVLFGIIKFYTLL
ncbi:MAG: hypothetical protein IKQ64_07220 [Bacteroidales bacterium]|jgi:hypothetical protein|nr:hypothetical protein [Bacteroidales bacterium]